VQAGGTGGEYCEREPTRYCAGSSRGRRSWVVFGDIGTSPLYTVQTVFNPSDPHPLKVSHDTIFGIVSLIFWSVTIIVTVTYVCL